MQLVNLKLLSHPFNWVIVWLVLAFAAMAWHAIYSGVQAASPDASISPD